MKYFFRLLVLSLGMVNGLLPTEAAAQGTEAVSEGEYEKYRRQGDERFDEGRYREAINQYRNCLEVPQHEQDEYALQQIERCKAAQALLEQLPAAQAGKEEQKLEELYLEVLKINKKDPAIRQQLGDLYELQGNVLFGRRQYADARRQMERALAYSNRRVILEETIRRIDAENSKSYYVPKRTGAKVAAGLVAVGAGAYAMLLRSQYNSRLNALNSIAAQADPSGSGTIATPDMYRRYTDAYAAAEAARARNSTYRAALGIAGVALLTEVFLLVKKPRARRVAVLVSPLPTAPMVAATLHF